MFECGNRQGVRVEAIVFRLDPISGPTSRMGMNIVQVVVGKQVSIPGAPRRLACLLS